jgi:Zn-dependent peptidase ImmA (M78 family)
MPKELIFDLLENIDDIDSEIEIIANKFKVSPLALARRLYSLKVITLEIYEQVYENSIKNYKLSKSNKGEGGKHYATKRSNLSTEFTKAVLISAEEGKTLYSDAYKLLNVSNSKTFEELTKGY